MELRAQLLLLTSTGGVKCEVWSVSTSVDIKDYILLVVDMFMMISGLNEAAISGNKTYYFAITCNNNVE